VYGESPLTAIYLNDLGYAQHLGGKNEDALVTLRESRAMFEKVYGSDKFDSGIPLCNLGAASMALGRFADARGFLSRSLEVFDTEAPDGFWSGWVLQYMTALTLLEGDATKAASLGERGLRVADRLPSALRLVPGVAVTMADALIATGRADRALPLCARALEVQERARLLAPDKVLDWDGLRCRGEALLALGRAAEAIEPLERSAAQPIRAMPWDLPRTKLALARAIEATHGDPARAAAIRAEAREALGRLGPGPAIVAADDARRGGSSAKGR
jgi:tetratricopeptide (TPR) repeat protein